MYQPRVGSIIGTLAHHHLQTAEKMWLMCAKKFSESSPRIAESIIHHLVPSPPLRQEQNTSKSASTDPWTSLTQSVGTLTGSFEKLTEATEECIRGIDDDSPPARSLSAPPTP